MIYRIQFKGDTGGVGERYFSYVTRMGGIFLSCIEEAAIYSSSKSAKAAIKEHDLGDEFKVSKHDN